MPRHFPDHFAIEQVQQILKEQQQGPYVAIPVNAVHFPNAKGIYFWYMRPEGYQLLSQHIAFPQPFTDQTVDQNGNHLVYLGTAGVGRGATNGAGLQDRFVWHVCQHHTIGNIRSGFLSTLRTTLGALLADDLLETNGVSTEQLINQFMAEYLCLTFIPYEGNAVQVGPLVGADEDKLIKTLKPLLNLMKNPNSRDVNGHPTRQIKARRIAVNLSTKARLNQP